METTSKKSEKILVEEITEIMRDLSFWSSKMEEWLARMRRGKKETGNGDLLIEKIPATLARMDGEISSLMVLSPDNKAIEIYQKKLDKWQAEFEELREQKSTISKMFSEIATTLPNPENVSKIHSIEFDQNNPQAITKSLLSLCERIDSKMNFNDSINNPKLGAMLAKFENGLALLKLADTESKYINHFETKYQEWKKTIKRNRFILISVLGILGIIITLAAILGTSYEKSILQ
jgi:cell division protein FtsB